ncbi:oxidoreductase [Sulfitobacter mediterraneus]|uniref:oxidoreductase n=1 Tax=Sulfitobacter mediterraneus TaxID=83219 RepID=UPI0021A655CB|nr:oxidoreductase [Sulfitobacter mediterraneus]UWR10665.1 SDR family oxidoreductase [Sulfitobacter mediterraneus]
MTQNLENMALVITGAASGIGRAVAIEAAEQGVRQILATDLNAEGLASLSDTLKGRAEVSCVVTNLAEPEAAQQIAESARAAFGRIDGLVNAAGITTRASVVDGTAADFDTIFAVNTRAPFLLMQEAIKDMQNREASGVIVNIQSMNAHCGPPELALYAASKGALQTLTKNAANAHLRDGIRVNGINLGWVRTEAEHNMQANILGHGEDWEKKAGRKLPLGRLVSSEETARSTLFLLSPASAPMTGVNLDFEQSVTGAPNAGIG